MNDEQIIWEIYVELNESNLISIDPLRLELEKILKQKGVQKPEIKNWFLKTYINWFKSPSDDDQKKLFISNYQAKNSDPDWAKKEGVFKFDGFTIEYTNRLNHLIDFLSTKDDVYLKSLFKVTVPQMFQEVQKWDHEMERSAEKAKNAKLQSVQGTDYRVTGVYDGYPVWELASNKSFREESIYMGHCVGQATGESKVTNVEGGESRYFREYKNHKLEIYSLRDPSKNNHPVVTFALDEDIYDREFKIYQIKGPANKSVNPRYWKACREFILDNEFTVKGDGENIGMIKWPNSMGTTRDPRYYFEDSEEFKHIYYYEILPKQKNIIADIKKRIKNKTISGDVSLNNLFLHELPDLSDVSVHGDFSCSDNKLTTLQGSPDFISTGFYCHNNKLKNLIGAPTKYNHSNPPNFMCHKNELETLNGSPDDVFFFNCGNNNLKSLEGSPINAYEFHCQYNQINTLKGRLKKVTAKFDCSYNQLNSLDYAPFIERKHLDLFFCGDNSKFFEHEDIIKCQEEAKKRLGINLESFKKFFTK